MLRTDSGMSGRSAWPKGGGLTRGSVAPGACSRVELHDPPGRDTRRQVLNLPFWADWSSDRHNLGLMSADDRLAVAVIFFVIVLPLLCFEIGARIGARRVRKAWRRAAEAGKPAAYKPLEQSPPKPVPSGFDELLSDYEDAVYFAARHSFVPGGMSQGDQNTFMADQARLVADIARLRGALLQRFGSSSLAPVDPKRTAGSGDARV